jgi:hypothetical protein
MPIPPEKWAIAFAPDLIQRQKQWISKNNY